MLLEALSMLLLSCMLSLALWFVCARWGQPPGCTFSLAPCFPLGRGEVMEQSWTLEAAGCGRASGAPVVHLRFHSDMCAPNGWGAVCCPRRVAGHTHVHNLCYPGKHASCPCGSVPGNRPGSFQLIVPVAPHLAWGGYPLRLGVHSRPLEC
jgi:hypothetical protein